MAAGQKFGGRKKGTPNKFTAGVKEMVLNALDKAGGEAYLLKQSEENPVAFMGLVGRILPSEMAAAALGHGITVSFVLQNAPSQSPILDVTPRFQITDGVTDNADTP